MCQALLVEVKGEDIRIRKLDLISNNYIGEDWTINTSEGVYGYKYTEDRAGKSKQPYFESNDKATIECIGKNSCILKINTAKVRGGKDIIEYYKVDFKNVETGEMEKSYKIWSQYVFIPEIKRIKSKFKNLKEDTEYEVLVTAFNAYGKSSINALQAKFKTK